MAAEALEQSMLESKDKDQLLAIAQALGIKTTARAAKATLIAKILETTGVGPAGSAPAPAGDDGPQAADAPAAESADEVILGPDGEPLANWEIDLVRRGEVERPAPAAPTAASDDDDGDEDGDDDGDDDGEGHAEGESRNARRRRRRRNKNRTGEGGDGQPGQLGQPGQPGQGQGQQPAQQGQSQQPRERGERPGRDEITEAPGLEPVQVAGYVDLREEGYGFLRVNGYLASRDDAYVPVKLTRQMSLRKGDHVTGLSRPAGRNEKNPALLEIHTINGRDPEEARNRPKFEDLTAIFPDERLKLELKNDPYNMTVRIIDLMSPIGKGQRGIIVSPPKAGKTTIMKTIAGAIEENNPEVTLMVLLLDERPEEVTDMRRTVKGEVIASTFDRPSEEHTHVAELAIEKAKRLVEMGHDVVIIVDGITRLSRAYNLAAPPSGRILSGGIDAGALYPPKKFFGAARNVEEGGSLTILATALVDTNSRMDEAIFEEFKGTGNMELRLDRRLAERRIFPAIDVDASSTRHEELLFDKKQLQLVWKLRRVLSGLAEGGNAAPGLELLQDRLKSFRTNDEFLAEIAKQPG
ncbi:MAG: transcription termination factor Rho [Actinomycetota bacterium]|nr:transcription termination factor Rho [Actinomycetota bacterium]